MIIDWLLGLIVGLINTLIGFFPTHHFEWEDSSVLWTITSKLGYFTTWGVPTSQIIYMLGLIMTMEASYLVIVLVVFMYNKIRGS